jgi:hypothetical protein
VPAGLRHQEWVSLWRISALWHAREAGAFEIRLQFIHIEKQTRHGVDRIETCRGVGNGKPARRFLCVGRYRHDIRRLQIAARPNDVLVPFENDTLLTINSAIWIDGSQKTAPRQPPGIGEHSDEILRGAKQICSSCCGSTPPSRRQQAR